MNRIKFQLLKINKFPRIGFDFVLKCTDDLYLKLGYGAYVSVLQLYGGYVNLRSLRDQDE